MEQTFADNHSLRTSYFFDTISRHPSSSRSRLVADSVETLQWSNTTSSCTSIWMALRKITATRENAQRLSRNGMEKEESKKTAMESKALSQGLCSVQADLSRYQKRQNCTKFEGDEFAKRVELRDEDEM